MSIPVYPKACLAEPAKALYPATAPDLFAFLQLQKETAKLLMVQCRQWGTRQKAPLQNPNEDPNQERC